MGYFIQGLASKYSAGMGLPSAFRVHSSCLPRALLVRFPSATEVIRGCKGQHDITNTVRQEQDGDTSNGALWPVRTPMFNDKLPPFGGTGQAEMKWPDWSQYMTMKGREQQENKWKETAFLSLWQQFQSYEFVSCLHAQVLIPLGNWKIWLPDSRNQKCYRPGNFWVGLKKYTKIST